MHQLRIAALICIVTFATGLGMGFAPAVADVSAFSDRDHDARPGLDIKRVRIENGQRILVAVNFRNLRPSSSDGLGVYFDTRGPDRGPEYVAGGGLGAVRDWAAVRIENWKGRGHLLLRCSIDMRVNYRLERATFDIARSCFNRPGRIRVSAKAIGNGEHDWAPKRHRFYDWVRR